jgi:hypothetical protein
VSRYEPVREGEWVQPVRRGYLLQCCDCSLVHVVDFRVHAGRIQLRAWRDERKTAASRRERKRALAKQV